MHFVRFRSTSLRVFKFVKIKDGGFNFCGEPIFQNVWIIWSPLLYFNFKSFPDPNSFSFIVFQCIFHDSGVLFYETGNFYKSKRGDLIFVGTNFAECLNYLVPFSLFQFKKFFRPKFFVIYQISIHFVWFRSTSVRVFKFVSIKEGGSNFWEEPILQNVWIIWSHLLYFNFKSFPDPSSSWFIRFQSVLYDSGVLLSGFSNFYKLKRGDLISVGNQFFRMSELFGPPSCISILKVFQTQILHHSLHFNVFCMIQEYFSKSPEISTN